MIGIRRTRLARGGPIAGASQRGGCSYARFGTGSGGSAAATGGLRAIVRVQSGAVASLTTAETAPTYLTALIPTRNVTQAVLVQPLAPSALASQPGQGITRPRGFEPALCQADTGRALGPSAQPVSLGLKLPDGALAQAGNNPARLALLRYDAASGLWYRLSVTVDAANGLVMATTSPANSALVILPAELRSCVAVARLGY